MDLHEIQQAVRALRERVSPRADIYFRVSSDDDASIAIYAEGISRYATLRVRSGKGGTLSDLFDKANLAWDEHASQHRAETVRKMALAIIDITAAQGRCSDAALRMKFPADDIARYGAEAVSDADDIARYGAEAVSDANEIASNGPFEISVSGGDNGAPAR